VFHGDESSSPGLIVIVEAREASVSSGNLLRHFNKDQWTAAWRLWWWGDRQWFQGPPAGRPCYQWPAVPFREDDRGPNQAHPSFRNSPMIPYPSQTNPDSV